MIYLLLNAAFLAAFLAVIPLREMAGNPFVAATAALRLFGPMGETVLRAVMIISLVASVNAILLMASRVPFAMSRDALLPRALAGSIAAAPRWSRCWPASCWRWR